MWQGVPQSNYILCAGEGSIFLDRFLICGPLSPFPTGETRTLNEMDKKCHMAKVKALAFFGCMGFALALFQLFWDLYGKQREGLEMLRGEHQERGRMSHGLLQSLAAMPYLGTMIKTGISRLRLLYLVQLYNGNSNYWGRGRMCYRGRHIWAQPDIQPPIDFRCSFSWICSIDQ